MELNFIEYLENKNFDADEIVKLEKFFVNKKFTCEQIIEKMDAIYKIFGYATLSNLDINKLILNNTNVLFKSDYEIISIAYTWLETGLIQEAASKTSIYADNYVRTYLRNIYLNSGINVLRSPISYNALRMGDVEFSQDYHGQIDLNSIMPTFENLINLYGKGNTYDEKYNYVKSIINLSALKWYIGNYKKEKYKKDEQRSI